MQRREYCDVSVNQTVNRGWGLFAAQDIEEGTMVTEYVGEVIPTSFIEKRLAKYKSEGAGPAIGCFR
jgi:SET domain-containing protein